MGGIGVASGGGGDGVVEGVAEDGGGDGVGGEVAEGDTLGGGSPVGTLEGAAVGWGVAEGDAVGGSAARRHPVSQAASAPALTPRKARREMARPLVLFSFVGHLDIVISLIAQCEESFYHV